MHEKLIVFFDKEKFFKNILQYNLSDQSEFRNCFYQENADGDSMYFNTGISYENIIIFLSSNGDYFFEEFTKQREVDSRIIMIPDDTVINDFECTREFFILRHTTVEPTMLKEGELSESPLFRGMIEQMEGKGSYYEKLAVLIGDLENETDQSLKVELIESFLFTFEGGKLEVAIKFLYNCLANNVNENAVLDLTSSNFILDENIKALIPSLFENRTQNINDDYILSLRNLRDYLFLQCNIK